ncbi:frequenin-2-like [Brevipalpus obovatus]|uniref:frequenin-2-like n=1 Tax=Brevipalpus obovatus TaxID=246614 RepID=UPI003D9FB038
MFTDMHIKHFCFRCFTNIMGNCNHKEEKKLISQLADQTYFTEREVKQWYKGFKKDCPGGHLTERSFLRIYQQFFPNGDPSRFAQLLFRAFDENQDGNIEFDEFIRALSVTSRGSPEEKLLWAFKLYDLDSDGFITRDEMCDILDSISVMIGEETTENEKFNPRERVNQIFQELDTNQDNRLSLEEFLKGSTSDPKIAQTLSLHRIG